MAYSKVLLHKPLLILSIISQQRAFFKDYYRSASKKTFLIHYSRLLSTGYLQRQKTHSILVSSRYKPLGLYLLYDNISEKAL